MTRTLKRKPAAWTRVAGSKETGDLVEFRMTPASALQYDMAIERATAAARQLQSSEAIRQAYGLDELVVTDVAEDNEDGPVLGLSTTLLATELALIIATDFRGYLGEDGRAAAVFSRRTVALAMQDWHNGQSVARHFLDLALAPVYRSKAEGKR